MTSTEAPMSVRQAIRDRRAVRSFFPDKISKRRITSLLTAATWAPTAMREEPWAFVVVQDHVLLKGISDRAKILLSSDEQRSDHHFSTETIARFTNPEFNIFYDAGTLIVICGKALGPFMTADCWLAAENLMLAACGEGLGSCVIGLSVPILQDQQVKKELGIPDDITPIAPIIVGKPRGTTPRTKRVSPHILSWI
jgi:nitroreductase